MYKVFINDKAIKLTDNYEDYGSNYDCLFLNYSSGEALWESIELLDTSDVVNELCIHSEDLPGLWTAFTDRYKVIEAAGGVVINDNKVLMIMKKDHWDLPKGKIDGSESVGEAAKREVSEECGLNNLSIGEELETTYHLYHENDTLLLKKTHWFKMTSDSEGPLKGDEKEGITDVQWVSEEDWKEKSSKSYASVINILKSIF